MKIFAFKGHIIFKCDYCHEEAKLEEQKSKRAFVTKLNKFHRDHDGSCKWRFEREQKRQEIIAISDGIIEKIKSNLELNKEG